MNELRMIARALLATGVAILLLGIFLAPAGAAEGESPERQVTPRPAWYSALTPASNPAPAPAPAVEPTVTPASDLLPDTGATFQHGWLALLGGCFLLGGLSLVAFGEVLAAEPEELSEQDEAD